jgi:hypothetical protein
VQRFGRAVHPTWVLTWRLNARALAAVLAIAAIWATVLAMYAATRRPAVAMAGAFDLTITSVLAIYLIAVRGGHLPRRALWLVIAAGLVVSRWLLAGAAVTTHAALGLALALELVAIAVVVVRIGRARRGWRTARAAGASAISALDRALAATGLPARIAAAIASELAVVAYALAGWRSPLRAPELFTVHRVNGWALYAGVFAALTLIEAPVLHLALAGFGHPAAAWVVSALSAYGALWFIGDLHALRHGGVVVYANAVELRLGIRWRGRIARDQIERVERGTAPDRGGDFSILGANVIVHLREPVTLHGLVGRRRTTSVVALSIDEPERFVAALTSA